MKEIKLQIDGQEITVHVDENELAKLTKPSRAATGYEQVKDGGLCYAMTLTGAEQYFDDGKNGFTYDEFNRGNYVNDKHLCKDRYRTRVLHDRLEQWQALNDEPVDWGDDGTKYRICFDYDEDQLYVCGDVWTRVGFAVYFSTSRKAKEAIEAFQDELMWYYTEYRSRLDEPERER